MATIEQGGQPKEIRNPSNPKPRLELNNKFRTFTRTLALASPLVLAGCTTFMDLSTSSITSCRAKIPMIELPDGRWAKVTNQAEAECHTRSTRFGWDNTPTQVLTTEPKPLPKRQLNIITIPDEPPIWEIPEGEYNFQTPPYEAPRKIPHEPGRTDSPLPPDIAPRKNDKPIELYIPPESEW